MSGIMCIEHHWRHEDDTDPSLKPILKWLEESFGESFEYAHQVTSGVEDLRFEVGKWAEGGHAHYPILYLANYGDEDALAHFAESTVRPPLADRLRKSQGPCAIHYGPSHDLEEMAAVYWGRTRENAGTDGRTNDAVARLFDKILDVTGAISVSGFRHGHMDGDEWLQGTIADLTLFANVVWAVREPQGEISSRVMQDAAKAVNNRSFVMKTPGGRMFDGSHRPRRRPSRLSR